MVRIPVSGWLEGLASAADAPEGADRRLGRSRRPKKGRLPEKARLDQVRAQRVSSYSDAELRDSIQDLAQRPHDVAGGDILPLVFAIVNEAVSRRQGAWRFFDPAVDKGCLQVYHTLADRIAQTPGYQQAVDQWAAQWSARGAAQGSANWEDFDRAVGLGYDRAHLRRAIEYIMASR